MLADAPGLIQIEPRTIENVQSVEQSELNINPFSLATIFTDSYGNLCRKLMYPQGDVTIDYSSTVTLSEKRLPILKPVQANYLELPEDCLLYLLPSRYCQSDLLVNMALDEFGNTEVGWTRVHTICEWINKHVNYFYGASNSGTSAYDTAAQRHGVCRDFAHLGIAFCRALGIPARYVSGYCLGLDPPDFHAWFQAFLDGRWVNFDATERQPRPALIAIALGRDAADCPWSTFYGSGMTKSIKVDVSEIADKEGE